MFHSCGLKIEIDRLPNSLQPISTIQSSVHNNCCSGDSVRLSMLTKETNTRRRRRRKKQTQRKDTQRM